MIDDSHKATIVVSYGQAKLMMSQLEKLKEDFAERTSVDMDLLRLNGLYYQLQEFTEREEAILKKEYFRGNT